MTVPLGDIGGENGIPVPSLGCLGRGDPRGRSPGRGLKGKPGVGGDIALRSLSGKSSNSVELTMAARDSVAPYWLPAICEGLSDDLPGARGDSGRYDRK